MRKAPIINKDVNNSLLVNFGPDESVTVVDAGFEVCKFSDLTHARLIERSPNVMRLRKQTFDFVLTLSNQSLVLIEAKAHECFGRGQLDRMIIAHGLLTLMNFAYIHRLCCCRCCRCC